MESSENQTDNQDYNINFLTGINWLLVSDYKEAIHFFFIAIIDTDPIDTNYSIYQSYAGLSSVLMHDLGGLHHCYHSSDTSSLIQPEVLLNLACAEFMSCHRNRGIQAIKNIDYEHISPENSKEILSFFDLVGKRERNAKGLLKRNNIIHKSIGRVFRKRKQAGIEQIEVFIKKTAKKRYHNAMIDVQNQPL